MYVACHTLCFGGEPLEGALRHIAEMEFFKVELSIDEVRGQLRPSEVAADPEAVLHRLRNGPNIALAAFSLDFGDAEAGTPAFRRRFEAICRIAKPLTVAVFTIPAAPLGTPFDAEVRRLTPLSAAAMREGLVLSLETHSATLTADPGVAAALCRAVPGLGLTLDPSHYIQGPHQGANYDEVFPFVQDVHLRDTGRKPGDFQVRVGQGEVDYARIITFLQRHGYNRSLTVSIFDRPENPFDIEVEVRKLKLLLESLI